MQSPKVIGWRAWFVDKNNHIVSFNSNDVEWADTPDTGCLSVVLYEDRIWYVGTGPGDPSKRYRRICDGKDWYCRDEVSGEWYFTRTHEEWGRHMPKPTHPGLVCRRGSGISDAVFLAVQDAAMAAETI